MSMEKYIYDQNNGLSYTLHGDYYLPDLTVQEGENASYGKYGILRKKYLKEYKPWRYQLMLLDGTLNAHLNMVDREAHEKVDRLVRQMAERQEVTEQLKAEQPMLWVKKMNMLKNMAEEIVLRELL